MKINFKLLLPFLVGVFAVSMFVQSARANEIDFQLAAQDQPGEGVITVSGGNFSTGPGQAIDITPSPVNPANLSGDVFDLTFNTATNTITIDGGAEAEGSADVFTGTITHVGINTGGSTESIDMTATWNALPADVLAFFGLPAGTGGNDLSHVGFVLDTTCTTTGQCTVNSVDIAIVPTPEPATLLLFGSGLLGLGGLVRRKLSA